MDYEISTSFLLRHFIYLTYELEVQYIITKVSWFLHSFIKILRIDRDSYTK